MKQALSWGAIVTFVLLVAWSGLVARPARAADTPKPVPCAACLRIRIGLPHVARGPAADIADNRFTEIALPGGGFRGFDAHGDTRAIDGRFPSDMGGAGRIVLSRGGPGSYDSCGQWLNHVEPAADQLLGFIHDETACKYEAGQTHKSMSLAVSRDEGLTWKGLGQIITGTDAPTPGRNTGEGDCTAVNGQDGYYYAYCFRPSDSGLIVARAPVQDPGPSHWQKFFNEKWDEPGLGGKATRLMNGSGASVARWTTTGDFVLTGWVGGGLGLFLGSDHTTFRPVGAPLMVVDPGVWQRPAPSELIAYPVLLDAATGSNQLSNAWMLVYAYWPPNEGNAHKYLVFRDVDVSITDHPESSPIGVLLARWYNPRLHDHWSTTAAVPGDGDAYKLEARSGYLMTAAPEGVAAVELEDCISQRPGHPDHILAPKGVCEAHAYQRLRTAGWVYAASQPDTLPLYRCYAEPEQSHFASNLADCEGKGTPEGLMGFALAH